MTASSLTARRSNRVHLPTYQADEVPRTLLAQGQRHAVESRRRVSPPSTCSHTLAHGICSTADLTRHGHVCSRVPSRSAPTTRRFAAWLSCLTFAAYDVIGDVVFVEGQFNSTTNPRPRHDAWWGSVCRHAMPAPVGMCLFGSFGTWLSSVLRRMSLFCRAPFDSNFASRPFCLGFGGCDAVWGMAPA